MEKIVVLDGYTLNPGDLSWEGLYPFGTVEIYDRSTPEQAIHRAEAATILLVNKHTVDEELLAAVPDLKLIVVTATGFNNIDLEATTARNIPVCNAVGYGSSSVAQHVFSCILAFTNQVAAFDTSVKRGDWARSLDFTYFLQPVQELKGKTIGIYGFGRIGQKVADLALAFEMNVLATHKHPERDARAGVTFVDLTTLFQQSDFVTLHAPLTKENEEIVDAQRLALMKSTAYLINTGRGGLIKESDLVDALKARKIAGAALDVLQQEPPSFNHPLYGLDNCIITPHHAWGSKTARQRLLQISVENIAAFLKGQPQNVVHK